MNITIYLCEKCKKNEVAIYNVLGDYCLECWEEITTPQITNQRPH
jgi:DNA-directed RNA polymerase subunit RPC12/RpoP